MFGSHAFGKSINLFNAEIKTYEDAGLYLYHRISDHQITKVLSSASSLIIHPVEPVTQPKEITHYLLIELKTPIFLAPQSTSRYFITFPIEVSIYISIKKNIEQIDSFTFTKPKYTLYGTPAHGPICKFWKSDVYSKIPDVNPYLEGVMKVKIQNTSSGWAELQKMVFNAYYMKIFYSNFACMNAVVKIQNNGAKTSFVEKPISDGMKKALELYRLRKIPIVEKEEFVMEWGL